MSRTYWKSCFSDFFRSKSRFFAIIAIVALGAGFFGGIKATSVDMKITADNYYKKMNLNDFRLVSTLGITDDDSKAISQIEGVSHVYPSYQVDAITEKNESQTGEFVSDNIIRIHSIEDAKGKTPINDLDLATGRMPEKPDECVVLADSSIGSSFAIGDKIKVDFKQDPDIKDDLAYSEFTVVGQVNSPLYMSIEKSTTSKGSGSVLNYAFVKNEAFSMDAYTELYLTLDKSAQLFCFDDDYKNLIEEFKTTLKDVGVNRCEIRKTEVIDEATETLNKNKVEFNDKKAEANQKLADAQIKLDDANAEIKSGEADIEKAKSDLENAKKKIADGEIELEKSQREFDDKINSAQAEIDKSREQIEASQKELDDKLNFLNSPAAGSMNQTEIEYAKAEIAEGQKQLDIGLATLNEKTKEFNTQKKDAQSKIDKARLDIVNGKDKIKTGQNDILTGTQDLSKGKEKLADAQKEYNEEKAKADQKLSDAEDKILDAEQKIKDIATPDWYVLPRDVNSGYAGFSQDANRIDAIAVVFPVFFFLVAALVCLTTMTRMVEEERTQIGVLKALGYSKNIISAKYILYAGITSIIGSIVGLLIGFQVFPRVIWAAYGIMYKTPPIMTPFNWKFALIATISFLIITIGATFFACSNELSSVPADLIRPKPPKSGKRVFLEKIPFIWKHLSFTKKLTARNILRYKKRFFMTVIGIAGCTALMLTGFGLKDSINGIVKNQFENLFHYDLQATFAHDIDLKNATQKQEQAITTLETDKRITNKLLIHQENFKAISSRSDNRLDAYLVVPEDITKVNDFITFQTRRGHKPVKFTEDGAIISEKLSNELNIKIGGEVILEDNDNKQVKIKVSGICENYVSNYVYISPKLYEKTFNKECTYRGVYAQISDTEQAFLDNLSSDLLKNNEFSGVSFTTSIVETFTNVFDRLDLVVIVLIFSASLLAFVVLYNLTNININERIREIATIKVLGFYDGEVDKYIYRENIVLTIIGTLTGFVLGIFLHQYVMRVAEVNIVMFGRDILPLSYLWAGLLTLLFGLLVNFAMHFRLKRVDMVESLKSIE